MGKVKRRLAFGLAGACLSVLLAAGLVLVPKGSSLAGAEDPPATNSLNGNLVVRYDMGQIAEKKTGGYVTERKIKASKWDGSQYVADSGMDATVSKENFVSKDVSVISGTDGTGAAKFGSGAYAVAGSKLNIGDATGLTVAAWVKDLTADWGGLIEVYDGTNGGRFGKSTITANAGTLGDKDWSRQQYPGAGADFSNGGSWNSYIHGNDKDNTGTDSLESDRWYFVAFTVTENSILHYRDGQLKISYPKTGGDEKSSTIISSIWAAISGGNANFAIRGSHSGDLPDGDKIDEFRIYKGAMGQEDITKLYNEYLGIKSFVGLKMKTDDAAYGNEEIDLQGMAYGGSVTVRTKVDGNVPKLLIGDATTVTEADGVYSATGTDFTYSYTTSEDGDKAFVTYVVNDTPFKFTVNVECIPSTVRLQDLRISLNGGPATTISGFHKDTRKYSITLSPDVYSVRFEATVTDGGTITNLADVNDNIQLNGKNTITVSDSDGSLNYVITLSRASAATDGGAPAIIVNGERVQLAQEASQTVYVTAVPAQASDVVVEPACVHGVTVSAVTYEDGAYKFTLTDKVDTTSKTDYSVIIKDKTEGWFAYWDCNEKSGSVLAGQKFENGAFVADASLNMTVRTTSNSVAPREDRPEANMNSAVSEFGGAVKLPSWGYTTANLPAVDTNSFTFSAWTKLSQGGAWEPVFSLYDHDQTKGVIFEKSHMQNAQFENNNPKPEYGAHCNVEGGTYEPRYTWQEFNSTKLQLLTVTVSYLDGVGVIRYYVNGVLIVSYVNHTMPSSGGGNQIAKTAIEALKSGAKFGLHRHCYDAGEISVYDEVRLFAYSMTAEEVASYYKAHVALLNVQDSAYAVEGVGYPDLLLGGATSVSGTTLKTGITSDGITYTYTPIAQAYATSATDNAGVAVVLTKDGAVRKINVSYARSLAAPQVTVNYTAGTADSVTLSDPQKVKTIKVPIGTSLISVTGTASVTPYEGDSNSAHYTASFEYDAQTKEATVTVRYSDYTEPVAVYTIAFDTIGTDASVVSVTVGGSGEVIDASKFSAEHNAKVNVTSVTSFSLTLSIHLSSGATVQNATAVGEDTYEITFTQADLTNGKLAFTVTAENGTSTTKYTLTPKVYSSAAALSSLAIGSYTLSPAFSASTYAYSVTVAKGAEGKTVLALVACEAAEDGTIFKSFDAANNKLMIKVTSEDGTTHQVYVVTVAYAAQSADASLKGIEFDGVRIDAFDSDCQQYTVTYTGSLASAIGKLTAVKNDANATVAKSEDGNAVTFTVTAEDGSTKTYTVTLVSGESVEISAENGTTEDNYKPAESGCNSSVSFGLVPIALAGVALVFILRKRRAQ